MSGQPTSTTESFKPRILPNANSKNSTGNRPCVVDGKRADGRGIDVLRPVYIKLGVVPAASGSAYVEFGQCKVLCSVYGPRPMARAHVYSKEGLVTVEFSRASFSIGLSDYATYAKEDTSGEVDKKASAHIADALKSCIRLELYPKSSIDVYCLVLQSDGVDETPAIAAATLALAHSRIEMYDLLVACTVACDSEGNLLLDPTDNELRVHARNSRATGSSNGDTSAHGQGESAVVTVATMPSLEQVTQVMHQGALSSTRLAEAVQYCLDAAQQVYALCRQALLSEYQAGKGH